MLKAGLIATSVLLACASQSVAATQAELVRAATAAGYCPISGVASVATQANGAARVVCIDPTEVAAGNAANGAFAAGGLGGIAVGGGALLLLALAAGGGGTTTTTTGK